MIGTKVIDVGTFLSILVVKATVGRIFKQENLKDTGIALKVESIFYLKYIKIIIFIFNIYILK